MERNNRVAAAVRRALVLSAVTAAGAAAPALAQENLGEIIVTGSRIRSANLEATTPVTQVTAADVVTQGVTRIEDLVNQLPQAFAAQNVTVANGASGTATLNLRGLGSPRTLVLVDGRRMPYGGVTNSAADINQIPTQMIERVDILTGGASAVYGSDAVAGVVNFIMKKDFEGVEITSQYNFYWHENDFGGPGAVKLRDTIDGLNAINPSQFALPDSTVTDGEGKEFSVVMGVNSGDGRGNITAYATVFDSDEVMQGDRDYSACSLATAAPLESFACGGSATSAGGLFTDFAGNYYLTPDTATDMRDFDFSTDLYNYGPLNHYQRPERRYSIGAMGHYEFSEHADVYTQLAFTDYESIAQIAPGGLFFETSTINCDNPLIPAGILPTIGCDAVGPTDSVPFYIGRRNVEGGGRQQSFANSTFRAVAGLRGAINDAWNYDVSAQFAQGTGTATTLNNFDLNRVKFALDVINDPDPLSETFGTPVCRAALPGGIDGNCVPYNPFVPGGITADQLAYLHVKGIQIGRINQEIYNGVISGDLGTYGFKSPWASDGVQVVFGTEYRRDSLTNNVDPLQEQGLLTGSGGPTIGISGATIVKELFFEGRLPLLQDQAMAESLSFDTAYRYSDYDAFETDTYKVGMEWAPVSDIRFRGSYQRAVRAANIVELFTAQGFNLFDMTGDPCGWNDNTPDPDNDDPGTPAPLTPELAAACVANGVPAANLGRPLLDSPAGQYNFLQGGNLALTPEESDTVSYGVVFTPRFAPGLAVTIDYFDIDIEDTISTFGAENSLDACLINGDADACSRINRNVNGQIWVGDGNVVDTNINIGSLGTKGYDLNATYTGLEVGRFGSLSFNLTGTYLDELITEPGPGIEPYDCVGFYSSVCGTPNPEWRHRFRTSWASPWNLDLSLTWRHYGEVEGFGFNPARIDFKLPAEDYFDLAANWAVTEKASVTLGINNFLDDSPSLSATVGTTGNGNTFPQTYDAMGRYVFLRARVGF
jgi:outer membrane receptor protein involved in Fe transport